MGIVDMQRAPRPSMKDSEGLQSATIEFADNGGVIVRCVPKMKPSKDGGMPAYPGESQQHVFSSLKEGLDYIDQKASGAAPMPETTLPEAKGAPPVNPSADEDIPDSYED